MVCLNLFLISWGSGGVCVRLSTVGIRRVRVMLGRSWKFNFIWSMSGVQRRGTGRVRSIIGSTRHAWTLANVGHNTRTRARSSAQDGRHRWWFGR